MTKLFFLILSLFYIFLTKPSFAESIVFEGKFFCKELSAKAFKVNGEINNVKLDGEGLDVDVIVKDGKNLLTTKFPTLSSKTKYEGVISLLNKDSNGNQILNAQFVAKDGGVFGTKTVTLTYQQATNLYFLISTEPFALGRDYPAIRTHFHQCNPRK